MFASGRRGQELADSPQVRTPAQTNRPHRIPRARDPLYGEPQDCSDDSAAGQCARLMHHPLPGRFRPAFAANGSPASIGPRRRSRHRAPADPSGVRPRSPQRLLPSRQGDLEAFILDRIGKRADGYHGPTEHPALTSACRSVSSSPSSTTIHSTG